jgi:hypothetical protein
VVVKDTILFWLPLREKEIMFLKKAEPCSIENLSTPTASIFFLQSIFELIRFLLRTILRSL